MNCRFFKIVRLLLGKFLLFLILAGFIFSPFAFASNDDYSPYGVMTHFERPDFYKIDDLRKSCKLIREAGIQWVLTCFNWKDVEPHQGHFDFSQTDRIVYITSSHNLKLMPLIWLCPEWAEDSSGGGKEKESYLYPPRDKEEFANFVYQLVKRYKNKIKYWQIWGEENTPGRWLPEADPAAYLNLLKASYQKIKEADPEAKVVLGGLALHDLDKFLEKLYQLGGKDYFDILAINPYVHPTLNYDPYLDKKGEALELLKDYIFSVRQIMAKHGDSLKPLWITEIGSPGQDQPGDWWLLGETPTEQEQAEWVTKIYTELLKEDLVDKIFWYNFRTPPDQLKARAGLVETDYRIKPAYQAYKKLPKLKKRQGFNVFLISVDCLRPDHLSCYGYWRPTTPTIDKLAGDGVRFARVISVAPWTSPSLISLLTSLYPPVHGVDGRTRSLPEGAPTPIKILKNLGYLVPGISYIHTVWNYQNLGFDVVKEPTRFEEKNEEVRINEWLDKNYRKKFFFWHHFYTPHIPYNPLPEYEKLFLQDEKELPREIRKKLRFVRTQPAIREGELSFTEEELFYIISLYDAEIRQLDDQIASVVNKLEELGILYKTILVITADHGEEFLEHGNIGHASTTLAASLYDECLRIPLIMWNPRLLPRSEIISQQIQNIDIMPTIFELLGIDLNIPVDGSSLIPLIQQKTDKPPREYAFSDTTPGGFQSTEEQEKRRINSIRTEDWKLIYNYSSEKENYLLFNLREDPKEEKNIIEDYPQIVRQLTFQLRRWVFNCLVKRKWFLAQGKKKEEKLLPPDLAGKISSPEVIYPGDNSNLTYEENSGKVILEWTGDPRLSYIVEYDVGLGNFNMKGDFPSEGTRQEFGPIPKDVWKLLPAYNPWKFRVKVKGQENLRSRWIRFNFSLPEE